MARLTLEALAAPNGVLQGFGRLANALVQAPRLRDQVAMDHRRLELARSAQEAARRARERQLDLSERRVVLMENEATFNREQQADALAAQAAAAEAAARRAREEFDANLRLKERGQTLDFTSSLVRAGVSARGSATQPSFETETRETASGDVIKNVKAGTTDAGPEGQRRAMAEAIIPGVSMASSMGGLSPDIGQQIMQLFTGQQPQQPLQTAIPQLPVAPTTPDFGQPDLEALLQQTLARPVPIADNPNLLPPQ